MAGLNGTGPEGKGKLTGRGLGNCDDANVEGGRTFGLGRGCGNGRRFLRNSGIGGGIWRVDSSNDEIKTLKERISELEAKLNKNNQ